MVEPQKDCALRAYYGYYVDSCDPPGEITPPSRLVVGSIGERKGAHVWGVPGTIRQKPEAAIQPTPTKPVKVPPLAQLPAIQATPTKSEKVTPLAQLPSYGHVTIRSANCAVLMNGPQQPGALCAECTDTKRFLQKKANKQKDPRALAVCRGGYAPMCMCTISMHIHLPPHHTQPQAHTHTRRWRYAPF